MKRLMNQLISTIAILMNIQTFSAKLIRGNLCVSRFASVLQPTTTTTILCALIFKMSWASLIMLCCPPTKDPDFWVVKTVFHAAKICSVHSDTIFHHNWTMPLHSNKSTMMDSRRDCFNLSASCWWTDTKLALYTRVKTSCVKKICSTTKLNHVLPIILRFWSGWVIKSNSRVGQSMQLDLTPSHHSPRVNTRATRHWDHMKSCFMCLHYFHWAKKVTSQESALLATIL
mmetsp:Transcript_18640/g.27770  ORF Transcript_18640/g.27770 Transcript_18640/m.27770 type:complete len:229 (-) Transcript_18640:370-1056(-)